MDSQPDKASTGIGHEVVSGDGDTEPGSGGYRLRAISVILLVLALAVLTTLYFVAELPGLQNTWQAGPASGVAPQPPVDPAGNAAARLAALQRDLEQLRDEVDNSLVAANLFWAVSEAEHLLVTAGHKLSFAGDADAALQLLRYADARLDGISEPALEEVRQHIADMAEALLALQAPGSREAMAMLRTLRDSVAAMEETAAAPALQDAVAVEGGSAEPGAEDSGNGSFWSVLWQDALSLIKIKKLAATEQSHIPAPVPREPWLVGWHLQQLHGAVLQRNDRMFQAALSDLRAVALSPAGAADADVEQQLAALEEVILWPQADTTALDSALESLRAYRRDRQ